MIELNPYGWVIGAVFFLDCVRFVQLQVAHQNASSHAKMQNIFSCKTAVLDCKEKFTQDEIGAVDIYTNM